ncbi:PI31 proteasome regulator domain-containing protein [Hirsutella rhossiliensis]|uniref:PI31 proteasome regulator domain-containing protein n=1 Tax=Hirsutella rhossiliensis TaxID=111463 RepID=A0A9P8MXA4_9HYPO|nr:PI31 proteasome regulator domain-containing protein [Hirsutella rhossiliensis]KAH0962889.1 PI31 proteasome regulator domain-containing protein [Hirsutella rhossiliensis]
MAAPPLSTSAVLERMASALPAHAVGDDSSDLASSYEAVALLIHAYLAALDFVLYGLDEDKPLSADDRARAPRLPPQWNARFGALGFVYSHKQSSMRFVFRVDRMGGKVEVRGLAVGDDRIHRFERNVRDVVRADALPVRIALTDHGSEDRAGLVDKLRGAFVSEQAIADVLHDLKVHIVQKLIPKLQKEGYVEEARDPRRPFRGDPEPNAPYPHPGLLPDLARPRPGSPVGDFPPPGFEDEHEINHPPRGGGGIVLPDGRSPFNIGHDDLNPPGLGPHDPLRGSFTGGGARLPRPGGPAGMHPTFDDPLFGGQGGDGFGDGGGFDPQAPPGARWDPIGPGGGPRFGGPGSGRFGGGGGGFGGGGGHII